MGGWVGGWMGACFVVCKDEDLGTIGSVLGSWTDGLVD